MELKLSARWWAERVAAEWRVTGEFSASEVIALATMLADRGQAATPEFRTLVNKAIAQISTEGRVKARRRGAPKGSGKKLTFDEEVCIAAEVHEDVARGLKQDDAFERAASRNGVHPSTVKRAYIDRKLLEWDDATPLDPVPAWERRDAADIAAEYAARTDGVIEIHVSARLVNRTTGELIVRDDNRPRPILVAIVTVERQGDGWSKTVRRLPLADSERFARVGECARRAELDAAEERINLTAET